MSDRQMTPAQQAADYERVNGAFDRARAQEVREHRPGGYRGDPGLDAAERRADRQGDATMQHLPELPSDRPIANGWTQREAEAMDRHISAKVGGEYVRSEPSHAAYRQAERASDPTDRMHDAGRERQADAYKPGQVTQAQRDASRTRASAAATQATDASLRQAQPSRFQGHER